MVRLTETVLRHSAEREIRDGETDKDAVFRHKSGREVGEMVS